MNSSWSTEQSNCMSTVDDAVANFLRSVQVSRAGAWQQQCSEYRTSWSVHSKSANCTRSDDTTSHFCAAKKNETLFTRVKNLKHSDSVNKLAYANIINV